MGKKSKTYQEQPLYLTPNMREELALRQSVGAEVRGFRIDDNQDNISFPSNPNPLDPFLALAKTPPPEQATTPLYPDLKAPSPYSLGLKPYQLQDLLRKQCFQIQEDIASGRLFHIEVQLHKGRQKTRSEETLLGDTLIKIRPMGANEPKFIFIKAGDTLNTSIFLGKGYHFNPGIMLIRDDDGNDYYLRLSDFSLLSYRDAPTPSDELGILTTYIWSSRIAHTSFLRGSSLDPLKLLFLSEWFNAKWQRAKDAATESSHKEIGSEPNEQK